MRLFYSSASPFMRTWVEGPLSLTQVCAARSTRKVACLARFTLAMSSGLRRRCNEITPSSVSDQDAGQLPSCRLKRPISARFYGVVSFLASARILVRRLDRRSRCLRASPSGRVRRKISSTCCVAMMESNTPSRPVLTEVKGVFD